MKVHKLAMGLALSAANVLVSAKPVSPRLEHRGAKIAHVEGVTLAVQSRLLGSFKVTSYRSVKNQTDNSPDWSSVGVHCNPWMIAASQDLLADGTVKYGDLVYVEGVGFRVISDTMNKRIKRQFDCWVSTRAEEKAFDKAFGKRKLKVWKIALEGN